MPLARKKDQTRKERRNPGGDVSKGSPAKAKEHSRMMLKLNSETESGKVAEPEYS